MNTQMEYPIVETSEELGEHAQMCREDGTLMFLVGAGGDGKTTVTKEVVCPALGMKGIEGEDFFSINASGSAPSEVKGTGVPDLETREMWFSNPSRWPTYKRVGDAPNVCLLDELPDWDMTVQSLTRSLFNPIGPRPMLGEHELSANTFFVVTGNRRMDGSRTSSMPTAPFVTRCTSLIWRPSLNEWLRWAGTKGYGTSPVYTFLTYNGNDQFGREGDFFSPPVPQPWDGSPQPCPREWEACCKLTVKGAPEWTDRVLRKSIEGKVGKAAGKACFAFIQTVAKQLPKLEGIKKGTEELPTNTAEQYALNHCALRQVSKDMGADPEAYVAAGNVDWLVERVMIPAQSEIREWSYRTARAVDIPLNLHPRRKDLQGV